jgi:hypothetical protein
MVRDLHDPNSATLPRAIEALKQGCVVIFDLSRMRGRPGTAINALFLQQIFDHNLESHTAGDLIPCISVIEEAQKVLSGTHSGDAHPVFVEWTKEGRKYGLGSVIVTQQPGVIDMEILSQSDTTFAFHVISKADLRALQSANAQFSDDILTALLNEPIEGQGYFWTSASNPKLSYPISVRVFDFGQVHRRLDADTLSQPVNTQAGPLARQFVPAGSPTGEQYEETVEEMLNKVYTTPSDAHRQHVNKYETQLKSILPLPAQGKPLFVVQKDMKGIPSFFGTQKATQFGRMWAAIEQWHGARGEGGWEVEKRTSKTGSNYLWIKPIGEPRK